MSNINKDMDYKSQNNEAEIVINYFDGRVGALLSLGENDGVTFSNSYDLIKLGWYAVLVEPCEPAFEKICELYKDNTNVSIFNFGMSTKTGKGILYQPKDSLIATSKRELLDNWEHAKEYDEIPTDFYSWAGAQLMYPVFTLKYEFITIDCEGLDLDILLQMDLEQIGCECICIEYSSNNDTYLKIKEHCSKFGLNKELLKNGENIIFAK